MKMARVHGIWEKATLERDAQCEVWLMHDLAIRFCLTFHFLIEQMSCVLLMRLDCEYRIAYQD